MNVVVDTNILFSLLLSKSIILREKFFDDDTTLLAPNYVIVELFEHKEEILKYSNLHAKDLY